MTAGKDDPEWMSQALALASEAMQQGEVPVGAILVRDGKILGAGYNQPISTHDPTAHAEIVALRSAATAVGNYRLPGATLYVTIEPCTMCVGAIIHSRIERLVFGATEPRAGAVCSTHRLLESDTYNHRVAYTAGVLQEECSSLIRDFFRSRR
jgi:tRNA(adenine34) deaminase